MVDKSPLFYNDVFGDESSSTDWGGFFEWEGVEVLDDTLQLIHYFYTGHRVSSPVFLEEITEVYESWIKWEVEGDLKLIEGEMVIRPSDLLYYRLHLEGNDVYMERLVGEFWTDRTYLFTYSGVPGRWFDLTFDQLGGVFVSWEQDEYVWIYWYDPIAQIYTQRNVCPGRTPICSVDAFHSYQSDISDIILFYIDDAADRVKYRLQRDRYDTVYETELKGFLYPVEQPNARDKDLLMAHMASNWRFYLWYRIKTEEEFTISYWHSAIYPIPVEMRDGQLAGARLKDATKEATVWWYYLETSDEEAALAGAALSSGLLVLKLKIVDVEDEAYEVAIAGSYLINSTIRAAILTKSIEDTEVSLMGAALSDADKKLTILRMWQDDHAELQGAYLANASLVEAA